MKTEKILIVDDEPHMRRLTEFSLRRGGYSHFTFAQDGNEALRLAKEMSPDLIIVDFIMPDLDGLGLLEKLKLSANMRHIPVIMVSGWGELHICHDPIARGASVVLTKPYSPTQLLEEADRLLSAPTAALAA